MQEPMSDYTPPLKKHRRKLPSRKIGRGVGIGGPVSLMIIAGLEAAGIEVSGVLAGAIGSVVTFLVGYLVKERV